MYFYRVKQYDKDGSITTSKIVQVLVPKHGRGNALSLYPNPTRDHMKVILQLGRDAEVEGHLFDMTGKRVLGNVIEKTDLERGVYEYEMNLEDMAQGVYMLRLVVGDEELVEKVTVIK